jgi:hypothetical protein
MNVQKIKNKFIEAYNNIAAVFANSDKTKAVDYFNKTLALDPANEYALSSIKLLTKKIFLSLFKSRYELIKNFTNIK